MTVAEIQEYIAESIKDASEFSTPKHRVIRYLRKIYSMLDELDDRPKAKWKHDDSQWKNRFICSKCGHKIFEEQQPYCSNCGARMNNELKENDE